MTPPNSSSHTMVQATQDPACPDSRRFQTGKQIPQRDTEPEPLEHVVSHVSTHDFVVAHGAGPTGAIRDVEDEDPIYDRLSPGRKTLIVSIMSYCASLAPMSSTTIMAAVPEVASTYETDGTIINLSNAAYLLAMGFSPLFWGPIAQIYGRRWSSVISIVLFFAFSIGSAAAPDLAAFFVFRILTAFQGTSLIIIGTAVIGDIYKPTERATYVGWFLTGTLVGPTLGPLLGGAIVTYKSWRDIFWLQAGLAGLAAVLVYFWLPETVHYKRSTELEGLSKKEYRIRLCDWLNPFRVVELWRYPNLLFCSIATGALVWNMYSLLTPIRYVLNPRFGLTSPLQSGLFYVAPGCGYMLGTLFGGRYADRIVHKWIARRGRRVPEDRLKSSFIAMGVVIPACMLVYGWSIERRKGGIALPVIVMFLQGVAQLICFPSLNTYCLDVNRKRAAEVIAGNYAARYLFGAVGTAVVLPAVRKIGVGWFSTISAIFLVVSTVGVWLTAQYGEQWRIQIETPKHQDEEKTIEVMQSAKGSINAGESLPQSGTH